MLRSRWSLAAAMALALGASACSPNKAPATTSSPAAPSSAADVATPKQDPAAMIEALYQPYLVEGRNPPDWREAVPWTTATHDLLQKEAAATAKTGEVGAIDGDIVVAAQDWKISNLHVALKAPPADGKAVVEAKFHNLDQDTTVLWDLVVEGGAWKVDNVHEPEVDLVKLLRDASKQ